MRAGLAASTVTPGRTAPVVSLTTPAIAPLVAVWADPIHGSAATIKAATNARLLSSIVLSFCVVAPGVAVVYDVASLVGPDADVSPMQLGPLVLEADIARRLEFVVRHRRNQRSVEIALDR